ncbi:MAG TPA: S-layer homology domain-containing protein, partial [Armatimonadota bacterium]|nr:S-layer homology domain-containing protein [Armatimonadota bacterium]
MRLRIGARVATVLLVALLLTAAGPVAADIVEFDDLPTWNWSWEYVHGVVNAGISQGYDDGYYRPEIIVTRDQMAVYVARALCGGDAYVPTGPVTATFEDVPNMGYGLDETEPYWAYRYVEYAVSQDVVQGYGDGLYHPLDDVTRGQMAVFMARAMCGGEE